MADYRSDPGKKPTDVPRSLDIKWLREGGITKETISWSEEMGVYLVEEGLTTSSFRKFFGEMRRIQNLKDSRKKEDILLLKAKLAYDAARKGDQGMKSFYLKLKDALETCGEQPDSFDRFVKIVEAVVAFHKFNGGRD